MKDNEYIVVKCALHRLTCMAFIWLRTVRMLSLKRTSSSVFSLTLYTSMFCLNWLRMA